MKLKRLYLLLSLFVVGCSINNSSTSSDNIASSNSISSSSVTSSNVSSNISSSSISSSSSLSSSLNSTSSSSSTSIELKEKNIQQIKELGKNLNNGETLNEIIFKGMYVKTISDNNDKLMLFVDETGYIYVRVNNWSKYLDNRYYNCYYEVNGIISKINDNIELKYVNLKNITDTPSNFDYSSITENKQSLSEVEEEFNKITLNNKYNGVGKIVTFEGTIIATDRSDANQKVVVYDGEKVLTIIDNKKICESNSIGNKYIFTGSLSVLHGSPAIWLLSSSYVSKTNLELNNYKEIVPSYFKKWCGLSNHLNPPAYNEFFTLFKVTGYVKYNTDFTTKYDLGLVDNENGTLSDQNVTGTIPGIFLMNNLSLNKQNEINNSIFFEHLNKKVTVYVTLHQFETNNHGWKVFPVDSTLSVIE